MLDKDDKYKESSWLVTGAMFVGFVLVLSWLLVFVGAVT
jgi:hypothetical protein